MSRDPKRVEVWEKYEGRCAYCGEILPYEKMQIDHIHPRHKGGQDRKANYHPSCRQCNFYKNTFTIEEFRNRVSTMHRRLEEAFIFRLALKYKIIKYTKWDELFYFERFK